MQKIFWTSKIIEGKITAMILTELSSGLCPCLSDDGEFVYMSFDNEADMRLQIEELNKPLYYSMFGSGYEVIELQNDSEEWFSLHDKWKNTEDLVREIHEFQKSNFFVKLYKWIKVSIFKPKPFKSNIS